MKNKMIKSLALLLTAVLLLCCMTACKTGDLLKGEPTREELIEVYNKALETLNGLKATQLTQTYEYEYTYYNITVNTKETMDASFAADESGKMSQCWADFESIDGDNKMNMVMALGEGKFYLDVSGSGIDDNIRYVSETTGEEFEEFLKSEIEASDIEAEETDVDISKFANVTRVNVSDKGYSIKITEPDTDYLPTLYKLYKGNIEEKFTKEGEMVSFEGSIDLDAQGNLIGQNFDLTAKCSEDESIKVKVTMQVTATDDAVKVEKINNPDDYKLIDSVPNLIDLMGSIGVGDFAEGKITSTKKIVTSSPVSLTSKMTTDVDYKTTMGYFTFDATDKLVISGAGINDQAKVTTKYSNGKIEVNASGKTTEKTATDDEAKSMLEGFCTIVPFDISAITGVSVTQKDTTKEYSFSVEEDTLEDYLDSVITSLGFYNNDDFDIKENKTQIKVIVEDGKMTRQECSFKMDFESDSVEFSGTVTLELEVKEAENKTEESK